MAAPHSRTDATGTASPSWQVGGLALHRVDETPLPPATGAWLLPDALPEVVGRLDWLRPDFADRTGVLALDSHSFALDLHGTRVVIDTGIGNGKTRANPAWHDLETGYLSLLAEAGFAPETVDLVVLTHLHTDHVGWNTRLERGRWVPTFPNARYVAARAERDFWSAYDMDEARRQMFRDSVDPVEEAGLADYPDVPEEGLQLRCGLRLLPTPGHTPGHLAVEVTDRGSRALVTGDCLHHPVQLAHPALGSCVDVDPEQAERTRQALLRSLAGTDTLLLGTHFPPPTAGRVAHAGGAYRLDAVPPHTA